MFKNLFGKKNDGFYMQIEEPPVTDASKAEQSAPVAAATPIKSTPDPVPVETPTANTTSVKTSVKDKKKKEQKLEPAPAAAAVETTTIDSGSNFTNFATDYLIKPSSNSNRRRPGANMKQFVDMARQVQFSNRSKGNEKMQG